MDRLVSMRVFQRVIDEGSFAAAARVLEMSPAAVTRQVTDLEQHLGVRLIQRTTRKLALTAAGEAYLQRVRTILHDVEDAEAAATADTRALHGCLRLQATPVLAAHLLAPCVRAWRDRHPALSLELAVEPQPLARVDEFDLTFVMAQDGFDARVVAHALFSTEAVACAAPAYLKRAGRPDTPGDLLEHAYLRSPWHEGAGHGQRRLCLHPVRDGGGGDCQLEVPVVLQSGSFDVLRRAALDGAGVVLLPRHLVAADLAGGTLEQVLPGWIGGRHTAYAVLPTRTLVPARTRAFLDFVTEALTRQSPAAATPRTP